MTGSSGGADDIAALAAAWRAVPDGSLSSAAAPDLAIWLSRAPGSTTMAESLVRLDALERYKRGWPASVAHYRGVLGSDHMASGSPVARMLAALELSLGGRTQDQLLAELGPEYAGDIQAAVAALAPSTLRATAQTQADPIIAPSGASPASPERWSHRHEGERIGPYTLRKRLGRGGFGEVWLADRADPFFRVAIKFLRPDRVDATSLARFQLERQALAALDHEGIAKIHDSGVLPDGSPYAVMQFVEGVPLTQYCDLNKLSVPERLELFAKVCDAVHHAHQQGFIHRDLSPDNILVTMLDGRPQPKIIDFGIAKVINKNLKLTQGTLTIDLRTLVGKPEYMAPEQAEASQIGIDTRSDVFALGVILYELLSGVLPLPAESLRERVIDEVLRAVREDRPDPSTRYFSLDQETRATMSLRRGDLGPDELGRLLRGRIRHLPMKALRADRTKRFSSAAAMATDVRNYLGGQDYVEAAAEPWADRASRHVRRHALLYAAGVAVVLALVAGLVTTSLMWSRATRAESQAVRNFGLAWQLFGRYISTVNDSESGGSATLADSSHDLRSVIDLARQQFPPSTDDERISMSNALEVLGKSLGGTRSHHRGNQKEAEAAHAESLQIREVVLATDPKNSRALLAAASSHIAIADIKRVTNRRAEAMADYERALDMLAQITSSDARSDQARRREAAATTALAVLHTQAGQYDKALEFNRRALDAKREIVRREPSEQNRRNVSVSLMDIAELEMSMNRADDALSRFDEAVTLRDALRELSNHNPRSTRDLGIALMYRAECLAQLQRGEDALRDLDRAESLLTEVLSAQASAERSRAAYTLAEVHLVRGGVYSDVALGKVNGVQLNVEEARRLARIAYQAAIDLVLPGCQDDANSTPNCHRLARAELGLALLDITEAGCTPARPRLTRAINLWRPAAQKPDDLEAARGFAESSVLLSECDVTAAREASDQGSRTTLLDQAARTAREALEALSRPEFQAALDATDHEIIDRANRVIDSAK